jgi:hypothetical protein
VTVARVAAPWMAGVLLFLGCGAEEAPCFEGPSATSTVQFVDFCNHDVPLQGVQACPMVDGHPCGCRTSNAHGWVDLSLPAAAEVITRVSADTLVPSHGFFRTPAEGMPTAGRYRPPPRTVVSAFATFAGVDIDWGLGIAVLDAAPVYGGCLEGSVAELLDGSGVAIQGGDGPFYVDTAGTTPVPHPEATASVGPSVFAAWLNLPPGPVFAHLSRGDGEPMLDRCGRFDSGWSRQLGDATVLEMEVFEGSVSVVIAQECEP